MPLGYNRIKDLKETRHVEELLNKESQELKDVEDFDLFMINISQAVYEQLEKITNKMWYRAYTLEQVYFTTSRSLPIQLIPSSSMSPPPHAPSASGGAGGGEGAGGRG